MLNNLVKFIFIISFSIFVGSCCFDNPIESYLELNPYLTEEILDTITLTEGISNDSLKLKNGEFWKYAMSIPNLTINSKVPLVIALPWDIEGVGEYVPYLQCQAYPGLADLNAIIFVPDNGITNSWDYENATLTLTLIDHALKYWPIDPDKIIVTGYSNGGYGAWYFGINYPQVFSAAIPIGSRMEYDGGTFIKNEKLKIPFYVIHSTSDEKFDINDMSNKLNKLIDLGSDIEFVSIDGLSHGSGCTYSIYLKESINWLENQIWR